MAAGDIIIPNNTITPEIMQKIAAEIIKQINTNTKDPGQWEVVESTNGVTSLPVLQVMGATYKLVRVAISTLQGVNGREVELQMNAERTAIQWRYVAVAGSDLQPTEWITLIDVSLLKGDPGETPEFRQGGAGLEWKYKSEGEDAWRVLVSIEVLKLKFSDLTEDNIAEFWRGVPDDVMAEFQKPATDAATKLTADVEKLEQRAETVISDVSESKALADDATKAATDAAALADKATGLANEATDKANTAAGNADEKAGLANTAAGKATASAGLADEKACLANTAAENADAKAGRADAAATLANTSAEKADKATKDALDATQAAIDSTAKANTAAENADEKAGLANTAAGSANAATEKANTAADNADRATELANAATQNADVATGRANTAAGNADTATGKADEAAGLANAAAGNADKATDAATKAADRATLLSNNRDKIVAGYWWKYDETLKDFVTTGVRATGETGQGLNIVGRYPIVDDLKAAYPDGVVGCFEVGSESPYEIWYYDAPAAEWRNSGRLQGPRGMSAFQVWQLQPGNEGRTEDEYFDWLSPLIDPDTGRWKVQGQDQGVQALGINAEVTEKENTEDSYILHVKSAKGEFDTPNIRGISVKVSEVENTEDSYKLAFKHAKGDFTTPNLRGISVKVVEKENTPDRYVLTFSHAKGEFTTPNLRGFDVKVEENAGNTPDEYKLDITTVTGKITTPNLKGRSGSAVIDIDHEPTSADTHYTHNGTQYAFSVGDEVRWYDADNEEYVLFKLYAVTAGGATWEELGSGGINLPVDVVLSSPTTLSDNDSLTYLDNGYLKEE